MTEHIEKNERDGFAILNKWETRKYNKSVLLGKQELKLCCQQWEEMW